MSLSDAIAQFHFLRPLWLLAVLPASALVILLWRRKASYGIWERVISPHLLPHLMQGGAGEQSRLPLVLLLAGWLLACLALAGPTWRKLPEAAQQKIDARVIVLDLSLSLYATDLPPSRLARARMKLTDILNQNREGLTALVVFAGTPHVVTPLTDDVNTIRSMVDSLSPDIMPIKGSDPVAALRRAVSVLRQGGIDSGRILLITDELPDDFARRTGKYLPASMRLSILGIGTAEGAPIRLPDGSFIKDPGGNVVVPRLDIEHLKKTARQLGGRFSTLATGDEDIHYLLSSDSLLDQEVKDTRREFDVWDELGPWLVVLILPLAAAGYRRGWLSALLLPLLGGLLTLGTPRPAQAFQWADLWQTPDQQAQALLEQGKSAEAARTFSRPDWKGASAYRSGNFEGAAQSFRQQTDADGPYNLGNALTELGQYDDAIAAYERALQLDPTNDDARHNAEVARRRKERQQSSDNSTGNSDPNRQGDDQQPSDQKDPQDQKGQQDQQDRQDPQETHQEPPPPQSTPGEQQDAKEQQDAPPRQPETPDQARQPSPPDEPADPQPPGQQPPREPQPADEPPSAAPAEPTQEPRQTEHQQALEQWLRRLPDDPGGLLRRKFERETQLRKSTPHGESTW